MRKLFNPLPYNVSTDLPEVSKGMDLCKIFQSLFTLKLNHYLAPSLTLDIPAHALIKSFKIVSCLPLKRPLPLFLLASYWDYVRTLSKQLLATDAPLRVKFKHDFLNCIYLKVLSLLFTSGTIHSQDWSRRAPAQSTRSIGFRGLTYMRSCGSWRI